MSRYWKAIIAVIGLLAVLATSLEAAWGDAAPEWVPVVAAVLTAAGVWAKANTAPPGSAPDPELSEVGPYVNDEGYTPRHRAGDAGESITGILAAVALALVIVWLLTVLF